MNASSGSQWEPLKIIFNRSVKYEAASKCRSVTIGNHINTGAARIKLGKLPTLKCYAEAETETRAGYEILTKLDGPEGKLAQCAEDEELRPKFRAEAAAQEKKRGIRQKIIRGPGVFCRTQIKRKTEILWTDEIF